MATKITPEIVAQVILFTAIGSVVIMAVMVAFPITHPHLKPVLRHIERGSRILMIGVVSVGVLLAGVFFFLVYSQYPDNFQEGLDKILYDSQEEPKLRQYLKLGSFALAALMVGAEFANRIAWVMRRSMGSPMTHPHLE